MSNKCWGFFHEKALNNGVVLNDTCNYNINNPQKYSSNKKHSGSTLLTLDIDANNSKELVLGDVSYDNFVMLTNGDASPNLDNSYMTAYDSLFPQNNNATQAVKINVFPAGFYIDVNNDNIKDLIASPNCKNGCVNNKNVYLYNNIGATNQPNFNLNTNSFLQEGMIEVGEGAHPVFFDYNNDGLQDIAIGNFGVFVSNNGGSNYKNAEKTVIENAANQHLNVDEIQQKIASLKLESSYIGILGKTIEPVIKPLGYDWKIGIALITSFAAREVFVGTLATIYSVESDDENTATIKQKMASEINYETGAKRFNFPVGMSLMVFYAFAMQCMATLAIVKRETKSWKWPLIQLFGLALLAYVSAFLTYQILS